MISGYVLFNPFAGGGNCVEDLSKLETLMDAKLEFHDITKVEDYKAIFAQMDADAFLVIAGGDGTLNRFVNATEGVQIPHEILYYPCGSGNDFAREIAPGNDGKPVSVKKYLNCLPQVEVKGKNTASLTVSVMVSTAIAAK